MLFELNTQNANTDLSLTKIATHITYRYVVKISGKIFKSTSNYKKFKNNFSEGIKIIILPLEHYAKNRDKNICLVAPNTYISSKTELIPNIFSKNEGLVQITELDNILTNIFIYYGRLGNLICLDKYFLKEFIGECYYPGEILFNSIEINTLTKIDSTNLITIRNETNSKYLTDFANTKYFVNLLFNVQ